MIPAAVLFDCDGVLADSEGLHNRILAEEITALGWEVTPEECERRFIGLPWDAIRPHIEARLGPDSVPPDFLKTLIARILRGLREELSPIPGAMAALEADSPTGARAGRAAGCRVLGLVHGVSGPALAASGAETFTRMDDLPGLLGLTLAR